MPKQLIGKIITILSLFLLTAGILTAWNTPAVKYESSIFLSTPWLFWISCAISFLIGTSLIVFFLRIEKGEGRYHNVYMGFLLVFLSYASLLSLFIIRGYFFWSAGDPPTHVGIIRDIINTGKCSIDIIYPLLHVYSAQIEQLTHLSIITVAKILPLIMALLSVLFTWILARALFSDQGKIVLVCVLSMTFTGGWYLSLTPNHISNLFFPLAIFLLLRFFHIGDFGWKALFVIAVMIFPVFHQVPAFALFIILLFLPVTRRLIRRYIHKNESFDQEPQISYNKWIFALYAVWSIAWISSFVVFERTVKNTFTLSLRGGQTQLGAIVEKIEYAASYAYSAVEMFMKTYSGLVIVCVLAFLALLYFWRKKPHADPLLFNLAGPMVLMCFLVVLLLLINVGFSPLRFLHYIYTLALFLAALTINLLLTTTGIRNHLLRLALLPTFTLIVVVLLVTLGTLNLFPSRYILKLNDQVPRSEVSGMGWFLYNNNQTIDNVTIATPVFRHADFILGYNARLERQDTRQYGRAELKLPFHFGYDETDKLGNYYVQDLYLMIYERDKVYYRDIVPEMAPYRFQAEDFKRLQSDSSLNNIFNNGGLNIYFITGLIEPEDLPN